jgi:hypothetical protein
MAAEGEVGEHPPVAVAAHGPLKRVSTAAWGGYESSDRTAKKEARRGLAPRPSCDSGLWSTIARMANRTSEGAQVSGSSISYGVQLGGFFYQALAKSLRDNEIGCTNTWR